MVEGVEKICSRGDKMWVAVVLDGMVELVDSMREVRRQGRHGALRMGTARVKERADEDMGELRT
jgi:hypothetical protein